MEKVSKYCREEILRVLEENPQEEIFAVEAFNFAADNYMTVGYIYPKRWGHGNMAEYMDREDLLALL